VRGWAQHHLPTVRFHLELAQRSQPGGVQLSRGRRDVPDAAAAPPAVRATMISAPSSP
jgi:hypothetical protein